MCIDIGLTKLTSDQVGVVLNSHFQKSTSETVLWEDEEHVLEDRSDLLQFVVVKVLQNEDDNRRDDSDEKVDASLN
jgi:hypothetical protein